MKQSYKDNAYWFTNSNGSTAGADKVLRDESGKVWRSGTSAQRKAAFNYTSGSGSFNRPLSGFEGSWGSYYYKGRKKVDLNYEGSADDIRRLTDMINKSEYDFDIWIQRGTGTDDIEEMLGLPFGSMYNMSDAELQKLVGQEGRRYGFTSTGVAKGQGFSYSSVIVNIYAPRGSKMIYAEPFSAYGNGDGFTWNGLTSQNSFGHEAEMIIQRGAQFKITKIERNGGTIYIDVEHHPEAGYDTFGQ